MKKEDGIKRICGNCRTKFYSFTDPIICPKCNTEFSLNFLFKKRNKIEINDIPNDIDDSIEIEEDEAAEAIDEDIDSTFTTEEVIYTAPEEIEE